MKRIALSLAAIGVLCLAADQALAQRVVSHRTATHVTAGHGIHRTSHIGTLHHYRQVGSYRHGYYGYPGGCGRVYGNPYVRHQYYSVPSHHQYRSYRSHYYRPYRGFSYSGPGFSIGIGF